MKKILALSFLISFAAIATAQKKSIKIDLNLKGAEVPRSMYGIFFEEINHSGDGGLYGELIQNRGFDNDILPGGMELRDGKACAPKKPCYSTGNLNNFQIPWHNSPLQYWELQVSPGAAAKVYVTDSLPLNSGNPNHAVIKISNAGADNAISLVNKGFNGITVKEGEKYNLRLFSRFSKGYQSEFQVILLSSEGKVLARKNFLPGNPEQWHEFTGQLIAEGSHNNCTLALKFYQKGEVWVDFVSLFPDSTYKHRPNGLRNDLALMLDSLKPAFVRWPGGCIVEGATMENRVKWFETLGDPASRPGEWNLWGYRSTQGFGYHEFLEFCEDIGADAMFVCNAGLSCEFRNGEYWPDDSLEILIRQAHDAIEYAIGDVSTPWGAKRAAAGHPKPFPLKYVEIGNENHGPYYHDRFNMFYKTLHEKWPEIKFILNMTYGEFHRIDQAVNETDIKDLHWYVGPTYFFNNSNLFDSIQPRQQVKYYVGEYACYSNVGKGYLIGALAEAAFISGMERNSDLVQMTSYAPLLNHVDYSIWPINLINFNNNQVVGSASYYVQKMYGLNRPSWNLPSVLSEPKKPVAKDFSGKIGLELRYGTGEFRNMKIMTGCKTVYEDSLKEDNGNWKPESGTWKITENGYLQTDSMTNARIFLAHRFKSEFTVEFEFRLLSGYGFEGLMLAIGVEDSANYYTLSWSEWSAKVEKIENSEVNELFLTSSPPLEMNRWYKVKCCVNGQNVKYFIDGDLAINYTLCDFYKHYMVSGYDEIHQEMVLKVINAEPEVFAPVITLEGNAEIGSSGTIITLSGDSPEAVNDFNNPSRIYPLTETFELFAKRFRYSFKPYSFTVLRIPCLLK